MFAQSKHEPFLQNGTGVDEVDDAIMDLVRICQLDENMAKEVAVEISSLKSFLDNNLFEINKRAMFIRDKTEPIAGYCRTDGV